MVITLSIAEKVRVKRAQRAWSKTKLAKELGISLKTLAKIEHGDYKAPKRIYQAVVNWLLEDY
ncbi:helix-turn-helix domain-containing protein [uncultured Streptococcus sp.]|uniref:helix-turn-helix domain-containing protein n=1 Tax=uncultured Streptococcus sp. TaxID=83427 RepID=UPI0027DB118F|nr:helix-turn-helix domain-containing protein [uncultured Streptococcus sp.]